MTVEKLGFDSMGIQECQKNRYPVLFVDRIAEAVPGKTAIGIKNFTFNEWYFHAHFEDDPNVPGFVQTECLVQTFLMTFLCMDRYRGMKTSCVGMDEVRYRRKIVPGDTLKICAVLDSLDKGIARGYAKSYVDDMPACSARLVVAIPEILNQYSPKRKKTDADQTDPAGDHG